MLAGLLLWILPCFCGWLFLVLGFGGCVLCVCATVAFGFNFGWPMLRLFCLVMFDCSCLGGFGLTCLCGCYCVSLV